MTKETLAKLDEAFALGCTDSEACLYADIGTRTLYEYQANNPEYQHRKEQLKETPFLKARRTIISSLSDPKDAQWYLERKKKDEFSTRVEQTGKDGKDLIPIPILANVQINNGNQENLRIEEADQSDTGGDISIENDIGTSIIDKLGTDRQEPDPDIDSIGNSTPLEEGSDEGLPSDNGEPSILQTGEME